jgi:hypothetical protein
VPEISVEAITANTASGGSNRDPFSEVTSLNVYFRQEGDERHVSLERETGSRWISAQSLSMCVACRTGIGYFPPLSYIDNRVLDRSDLEIVASCRAYGELGFVAFAGDRLTNDDACPVESTLWLHRV